MINGLFLKYSFEFFLYFGKFFFSSVNIGIHIHHEVARQISMDNLKKQGWK
jgi:hypothetical protein